MLSHSNKEPGLISKAPSANKRYESLTLQLENQVDCKLNIKDLSTVHTVLVEGYESRKTFPKFSLPEEKKPVVSVIVPAYNKFAMTYHCIASVALAFNKTSYEVILADDCSEDETTKAETIIANLQISRNKENLRFLRSCNAATAKARGKYIVFLNNDTDVSSYWLDELIAQHEKDESVGLTGSKLLNADGTLQEAGGIIWGMESLGMWGVISLHMRPNGIMFAKSITSLAQLCVCAKMFGKKSVNSVKSLCLVTMRMLISR